MQYFNLNHRPEMYCKFSREITFTGKAQAKVNLDFIKYENSLECHICLRLLFLKIGK